MFDGVAAFVAVAEELSFTRAATRLGVTTAAVSKAVLALEARLGTALLTRTSRAVALTREGARFLARCSEAMGTLRAAHDELETARTPAGLLRVSLSTIITPILTPRLGAFLSRFPRVQLQLDATNHLARFPTDRVDLALRLGPLSDSSLVARPVGRTRWLTVASPSLVSRRAPKTLAELDQLDAVQFVNVDGRARPWVFDVDGATTPFTPSRVSLRLTDGRDLLPAAIAGLGVVQVLGFMARPLVTRGEVVELLPASASTGPTLHAVTTRAFAQTPLARAFTRFVADTFEELSA